MKIKVFLPAILICISWIVYSGFSSNDEDPRWSKNPSTRINLNPEGDYIELPQGTLENYSSETRFTSTPQGVFAVGPNFRVHPTAARTQSETPITRHPRDPRIMFASANTFNVGGTTTFSTSHYVTTDGGVTFFGDDTTNFNFGDPGPMVRFDSRLLISYITGTGSMGAAWSSNLGATWSATVTFPGATTSADKNLSCTDGIPTSPFYGRAYTVYTEFAGANSGRIVATWSSDGGVTWSSVIPISPVPSAGHHHQGCDVAVDPYGWVRVVYANCTTNGQNSTEDYLGWAESGNGGVTWLDMSDVKVNMNGIRTSSLLPAPAAVIRANGFPRIDIDRTCLPSSDDAYVVAGEKNFAPALDNADIVLMKTPDGGSTWTRTRVNQNPAGSYEYFPAVNVDETGGINVCYYSTRGIPTNDSARIYLSRSTDGGATWVDILVSDHKFKPVPIAGTAAGYQGDYIGITSGGAGKIIPYWCEQNPTTGGRYQAYAALVDITVPNICEDFSCNKDTGGVFPLTTRNFFEEYSGTNYWNRRSAASAYNIGAGSARFNGWSAPVGTSQSLISYQFPNAPANTFITFDVAYAPWSGGNVDSLIIETSNNFGASYTILQRLWGGLGGAAGPLNTVFTGGGQFTPTGGQWRPRIYAIPAGTNKIKLRGRSGFGNDIWLDNICVQTLSAPVANSIGLMNQGMFIPNDPYWRLQDTIRLYYARTDFPSVIVDSAISVVGTNAVVPNFIFTRALSGTYYKIVKHRNSIRTWSNAGIAYTRGSGTSHFNFLQPDGQAFGNNQAVVNNVPLYRGIYSGDVNQDGSVDLTDVTTVHNAAVVFQTGYRVTDVTGDNITDLSDLLITHNNNAAFVAVVKPAGADTPDIPNFEHMEKPAAFENEEMRQKYELTLKHMEEAKIRLEMERSESEKESQAPKVNKKRSTQKYELRPPNTTGTEVGNP
jgi:hypothetical protein